MTYNANANTPATGFYVRGSVGSGVDVEDLTTFVQQELNRLQEAMEQMRSFGYLSPQSELPVSAYDGQMAYFLAGVAGPAEGFYGYEAGSWNKL